MDYGLSEDQQMIREAADVFADEQIKPLGEAIEYGTPDWRILFGRRVSWAFSACVCRRT